MRECSCGFTCASFASEAWAAHVKSSPHRRHRLLSAPEPPKTPAQRARIPQLFELLSSGGLAVSPPTGEESSEEHHQAKVLLDEAEDPAGAEETLAVSLQRAAETSLIERARQLLSSMPANVDQAEELLVPRVCISLEELQPSVEWRTPEVGRERIEPSSSAKHSCGRDLLARRPSRDFGGSQASSRAGSVASIASSTPSGGGGRGDGSRTRCWAEESLLHRQMEREDAWRSPCASRAAPPRRPSSEQPPSATLSRMSSQISSRVSSRRSTSPPPQLPAPDWRAAESRAETAWAAMDEDSPKYSRTRHWEPRARAGPLPTSDELAWERRALRIVNRHIALTGGCSVARLG
jgi:hypothetical protein